MRAPAIREGQPLAAGVTPGRSPVVARETRGAFVVPGRWPRQRRPGQRVLTYRRGLGGGRGGKPEGRSPGPCWVAGGPPRVPGDGSSFARRSRSTRPRARRGLHPPQGRSRVAGAPAAGTLLAGGWGGGALRTMGRKCRRFRAGVSTRDYHREFLVRESRHGVGGIPTIHRYLLLTSRLLGSLIQGYSAEARKRSNSPHPWPGQSPGKPPLEGVQLPVRVKPPA